MPTPKKRTTIRDVAAAAGVSISTVSMALRGRAHVSEKTKERIAKAAKKLNYHSDLLYSLIASRRSLREIKETFSIGALLDLNQPNGLNALNSLKRAVEAIGCTFESFNVSGMEKIDRPLDILRARGCGGIILRIPYSPNLQTANFDDLAVVCIDELSSHSPWPFDIIKRAHGYDIRTVWNKLYHAGYRRIGAAVYKHSPTFSDDLERLGAVLSMQHDLHPPEERVAPLWTTDRSFPFFTEWVKREKPDAVISFSTLGLWSLHDMGLKIPRDIGLVILHNVSETIKIKGTVYRPSGYFWNDFILAQTTVNILIDKLRREELGPSSHPLIHLLPATWYEGETIRH